MHKWKNSHKQGHQTESVLQKSLLSPHIKIPPFYTLDAVVKHPVGKSSHMIPNEEMFQLSFAQRESHNNPPSF
jgi:hypothetical protein